MELSVVPVKVVIGSLILILVSDIVAAESGSCHWETQRNGFEQKKEEEDCRQFLQSLTTCLGDFAAAVNEHDVCVLTKIEVDEFEASFRDSLSRLKAADYSPEKLQAPDTKLDEACPSKPLQSEEIHDPENETREKDLAKIQAFLEISIGILPFKNFLFWGGVWAGWFIILVKLIGTIDTIQRTFIRSYDVMESYDLIE